MRYLVLFLITVLWHGIASAQGTGKSAVIEYDVFGVPKQVLREIGTSSQSDSLTLPKIDCNDIDLLQQVRQKVVDLLSVSEDENVVERRARRLALKHINNFTDLNVSDFRPRDNYRVANQMIAVKINKHLKDEELKLCVSDNPVLDRKVYLLIYLYDNSVFVDIINYTSTVGNGEPFIIYKKQLANTVAQ